MKKIRVNSIAHKLMLYILPIVLLLTFVIYTITFPMYQNAQMIGIFTADLKMQYIQ